MSEPVDIGGGGGRDNRRVLLLAGAAAVVLLAVVVLPGLLFSDGGSPTTDEAFPPGQVPATTTTVAEVAPEETFEPFTTKDPFEPPIELGGTVGGAAPDVGVSTPGSSGPGEGELDGDFDDVDDVDDVADPPPGGDEAGFDSPGGDGGSAPPAGEESPTTTQPPPRQTQRVSLLEVYTDPGGRVVASVRVNDITYQVGEGDDFATSYRVLDLDIGTRCGQFLYGDDRFGLCENEEVVR